MGKHRKRFLLTFFIIYAVVHLTLVHNLEHKDGSILDVSLNSDIPSYQGEQRWLSLVSNGRMNPVEGNWVLKNFEYCTESVVQDGSGSLRSTLHQTGSSASQVLNLKDVLGPNSLPDFVHVSCWCKADGVTGERDIGFSMRADVLDVSGRWSAWHADCAVFTHDWQTLAFDISTGASISKIEIYLVFQEGRIGTALFDHVSVQTYGIFDSAYHLEEPISGSPGDLLSTEAISRRLMEVVNSYNQIQTRVKLDGAVLLSGFRFHDCRITFNAVFTTRFCNAKNAHPQIHNNMSLSIVDYSNSECVFGLVSRNEEFSMDTEEIVFIITPVRDNMTSLVEMRDSFVQMHDQDRNFVWIIVDASERRTSPERQFLNTLCQKCPFSTLIFFRGVQDLQLDEFWLSEALRNGVLMTEYYEQNSLSPSSRSSSSTKLMILVLDCGIKITQNLLRTVRIVTISGRSIGVPFVNIDLQDDDFNSHSANLRAISFYSDDYVKLDIANRNFLDYHELALIFQNSGRLVLQHDCDMCCEMARHDRGDQDQLTFELPSKSGSVLDSLKLERILNNDQYDSIAQIELEAVNTIAFPNRVEDLFKAFDRKTGAYVFLARSLNSKILLTSPEPVVYLHTYLKVFGKLQLLENQAEAIMCTHLSLDGRILPLEAHLDVWSGFISVSAFHKGTSTSIATEALLLETIGLLGSNHNPKSNIVISIFQDNSARAYPINRMRNLAIEQIPFGNSFILLDVDIVLNQGAEKVFSKLAQKQDPKTVYIVPCFEYGAAKKGAGTNDTQLEQELLNFAFVNHNPWHYGLPLTRKQLDIACDHALVRQVKLNWYAPGHACEDFEGFWSGLHKKPWPVSCVRSQNWEPYFLAKRARSFPPFNEKMIGWGGNKVAHMIELEIARYNFLNVPDVFVMHIPHHHPAKIWKEQRYNRPIFKEIVKRLGDETCECELPPTRNASCGGGKLLSSVDYRRAVRDIFNAR